MAKYGRFRKWDIPFNNRTPPVDDKFCLFIVNLKEDLKSVQELEILIHIYICLSKSSSYIICLSKPTNYQTTPISTADMGVSLHPKNWTGDHNFSSFTEILN